MDRDYRVITGVCYPVLFKGENQPKQVKASEENRVDFYLDDAIRLSEADVKGFQSRPLILEHGNDLEELKNEFGITNHKEPIGQIFHTGVDPDGKMRMMARLYTDTPQGKKIYAAIESGKLKGLSVGYRPGVNNGTNQVEYKLFDEVSLCKTPFFQGAEVSVTASSKTNLSKEKKLWFSFTTNMAEQEQQQPKLDTPQIPQPVAQNKEASVILRGADEIAKELEKRDKDFQDRTKENEELKAQLEKLKPLAEAQEKWLAEQERIEQEARAARADEIMSVVQSTLAKLQKPEEIDTLGVNQLSQAIRASGTDRVSQVLASVIVAESKRSAELEKENKELHAKISSTSDVLEKVTQTSRVNASMESVMNDRKPEQTGNLADTQQNSINSLFRIPDEQICRRFGFTSEVAVNASATEKNPNSAPRAFFPRTMGDNVFQWMVQNANKLADLTDPDEITKQVTNDPPR